MTTRSMPVRAWVTTFAVCAFALSVSLVVASAPPV